MNKILGAFIFLSLPALADLSVKQVEGRIDVLEDEKVLTSYHVSRIPYIYPLPSDSGANLARYWPIEEGVEGEETDHPHHRSLWLSHGDVNGFDFWAWKGGGEPKIVHQGVDNIESGEDFAAFTVALDWVADGKSLLKESRRMRFSRVSPKTWTIEVISELRPSGSEPVEFGDTKEGSFALRVDRTLRLKGETAKGHILDSEKRTDADCWGKRSKWVAFHGPDEKGEPAVVAMLDHPDNLRHPTWWHARDYGLLAANPFGIHDFESKKDKTLGDHVLKPGDTLKQRYLVVLHHGTTESADIEGIWTGFSE